MDYNYVVITLAGLNIFQFIFWSIQQHKLVNKLMSRNYAEYNQIISPAPIEQREIIDFRPHKEEEDILNELNGMLPG